MEVDGGEVHLTPIEYKILLLLIANRGKVLTHHYILKEIWGYAEGVESGTLRVFTHSTLSPKWGSDTGFSKRGQSGRTARNRGW